MTRIIKVNRNRYKLEKELNLERKFDLQEIYKSAGEIFFKKKAQTGIINNKNSYNANTKSVLHMTGKIVNKVLTNEQSNLLELFSQIIG